MLTMTMTVTIYWINNPGVDITINVKINITCSGHRCHFDDTLNNNDDHNNDDDDNRSCKQQ